MSTNRAAAGEGKLGCILWLALLVAGGLIAWTAIPVKIAAAELQDFMVEQAKFAAASPPETIAARIFNKATELNLPLDKKNVAVAKGGGRIKMQASFTVPLEFPGYVYYWDFDLEVDRPIFIF
jgi:hypothetical protein